MTIIDLLTPASLTETTPLLADANCTFSRVVIAEKNRHTLSLPATYWLVLNGYATLISSVSDESDPQNEVRQSIGPGHLLSAYETDLPAQILYNDGESPLVLLQIQIETEKP